MNPPETNSSTKTKIVRYPTAHLIREIGRGVKGARSLSASDAHDLFQAIIDGRVSDLELGAIVIALRIKGESIDEIDGFLRAAEASFAPLTAPQASFAPIVIPSYNGARRLANLTPLLAMLLAREGVPVLVHGVEQDSGRVTSAEIFRVLGINPTVNTQNVVQNWQNKLPVWMPIDVLAPRLAQLLALRKMLGLRNSTHTLVKIIQPFSQPALRLTSYTHPEYATMLAQFFGEVADPSRGDVLLMRGTEGETVAHTNRVRQIDWFHGRVKTTLVEDQPGGDVALAVPVDAEGTAEWINSVLAGREPVPENIAQQVNHCLMVARKMKNNLQGESE